MALTRKIVTDYIEATRSYSSGSFLELRSWLMDISNDLLTLRAETANFMRGPGQGQTSLNPVLAEVKITYFKDTGKYYTSVEPVPIHIREKFSNRDDPRKVIRQLNGDGELPGLASGTWDAGTVHVVVNGLPYVIGPYS